MARRPAQPVRDLLRRPGRGPPSSGRRPPPPATRRTCRRPAAPPSRGPRTRPGQPTWSGSRTRRATASALIPSNIEWFGYVSATGTAAGCAWRRTSDQATSRKRRSPGSWTAVIGASPCSVGPMSAKPPSASRAARMRLGTLGDLVGRHGHAHVRLVRDVVAEVGRRVDDLHVTLRLRWISRSGDLEDGRGDLVRTVAHQVVTVVAERHGSIGGRPAARRRRLGGGERLRPGPLSSSAASSATTGASIAGECRHRLVGEHRADAGFERVRPRRRHHLPRVGLDDRRSRRAILIGVPGRRIERRPVRQERVSDRMTSGGSSRPRRNSSASMPVASSRSSQPPSTRTSPAHRSPRASAA